MNETKEEVRENALGKFLNVDVNREAVYKYFENTTPTSFVEDLLDVRAKGYKAGMVVAQNNIQRNWDHLVAEKKNLQACLNEKESVIQQLTRELAEKKNFSNETLLSHVQRENKLLLACSKALYFLDGGNISDKEVRAAIHEALED